LGIAALSEEVSPRAVVALSVILVGMAIAQYQRPSRDG
jgi:hypothetical protein